MTAEASYAAAERKVTKMFFKDYEGAQELFAKAGARFRLDKNFVRAGDAYTRAGDCAVKVGDAFAAAQAYADAAQSYRHCDMRKARSALDMAVHMHVDNNRLGSAARLLKELADAIAEGTTATMTTTTTTRDGSASNDATTTTTSAAAAAAADAGALAAVPLYEQAMRYFEAEDQRAQAQSCMLAMAKLYGEHDDFDKALMYYERVANNMVDGPLRFQAQSYFVRAMLCRFALVTNDARMERSSECAEALQRYLATDTYLKNTREAEFLQLMLEAVTDSDLEKLTDAVAMLDSLRKLDAWTTHALLVVKHNMESIA